MRSRYKLTLFRNDDRYYSEVFDTTEELITEINNHIIPTTTHFRVDKIQIPGAKLIKTSGIINIDKFTNYFRLTNN